MSLLLVTRLTNCVVTGSQIKTQLKNIVNLTNKGRHFMQRKPKNIIEIALRETLKGKNWKLQQNSKPE